MHLSTTKERKNDDTVETRKKPFALYPFPWFSCYFACVPSFLVTWLFFLGLLSKCYTLPTLTYTHINVTLYPQLHIHTPSCGSGTLLIASQLIHLDPANHYFIFFYSEMNFHPVHVPHFHCTFTHWWPSGMVSCPCSSRVQHSRAADMMCEHLHGET